MKEKRKRVSIRWQLIVVVLLVQIPFCGFFLYGFSSTVRQMDNLLAQSQQNSLNVYRDTLEKEINDAGIFLFTRCWGAEELQEAGAASDREAAGDVLRPLMLEARWMRDSNPELNSITFYARRSGGNWTVTGQEGELAEDHTYYQLLCESIREDRSINEGWTIQDYKGEKLLVRICCYQGVYVMITMDLNAIALKENIYGSTPVTIVLSKGGQILNRVARLRGTELEDIEIRNSGDWLFATDPNSGYRYQVVQASLAGMTISMGTRYQYDWTWMRILGIGLVGVFVLTLILGLLYLDRTFFRPLNDLVSVMDSIGSGEKPTVDLPKQNREFTQISTIFQGMLATLEKQKIAVYENKIRAQKMETNALRLQIRRHFFLNCLKNIYATANTGDMESVKKIVLLLSVNLRYTLDYHKDAVELEKELQMCGNYVELQAVGQDRPPVLRTKIDPELAQFPIPPVSVLTMLENCCKYGTRMDAALEITVSAERRIMDDQKFVCIAIQDNGPGFRQEDLFALNNHLSQVQENGHIGVANTMARIRMMYGENCEVLFSNRGGARVEWIIPVSDRKEPTHEASGS